MIDSRESMVRALAHYVTSYPAENNYIKRFQDLLLQPRCFFRDHLPGHLTASAWILNSNYTKVFLVRHTKLQKWLQPGGHADGDENLFRVAMKEVSEETGLRLLSPLTDGFFDIDIHQIPKRGEFPEHDHYDVRFALVADENQSYTRNEESTEIGWKLMSSLNDYLEPDSSITRMVRKTVTLAS